MVEGKPIPKASILKVMGPGTGPHPFNCIKQVRGFSQFDMAPVPVQEGDSILGGTMMILVNDPVASLIQVQGDTFLAILVLCNIK